MLDLVRSSNFNLNMFHIPRVPNASYLMSVSAVGKNIYNSKKPTTYTSRKAPVKAATHISEGSKTDVIEVSSLVEKSSPHIKYLEVADSNGRIYCVDRNINTSCWLKIVKISDDCQSSNVELAANSHGVYLKSKRSIGEGEPLSMWFESSILAMLDMPYLTHMNIQGQNDYVCHKCNDHFSAPNPLKIHLVTKCNQLDDNYLWYQLSKQFKVHIAPQASLGTFELSSSLPNFGFNLPNSPTTSLARYSPISSDSGISTAASSTLNLSATSLISSGSPPSPVRTISSVSSNQASPPSPRKSLAFYPASSSSPIKKSAFKPYITSKPCQGVPAITPPPLAITPPQQHQPQQQPSLLPLPAPLEVSPMLMPNPFSIRARPDGAPTDPAEMETIVSNMGKCKGGHVCVYCGKVYSRKYGLKIHIRTHTGYKPLKCKYCLRPFGDPSNLNKHVRLHADGDTPYKCPHEHCGKVLVRRRDLDRHLKSRHPDPEADHHMSDASSDASDIYSASERNYC